MTTKAVAHQRALELAGRERMDVRYGRNGRAHCSQRELIDLVDELTALRGTLRKLDHMLASDGILYLVAEARETIRDALGEGNG